MRKLLVTIAIPVAISGAVWGQGIGRSDSPAYKPYYDSLKGMDYPYALPIFGKQAYKRGYDLSLAWGISGIYFAQTQEIVIDQTLIGINGSEMVDISRFIRFGPTIAKTNAYTIRPDVWLFPFLNLYAILGGGTTETTVNLLDPIGLNTTQRFSVSSYGIGITAAGAIGPLWVAWDNNYNFADIEVVVEPVPAFNSSLRVGHTIMDASNPQRSLSVWCGLFYQVIQNDTEGSIPVPDIFPGLGDGNVVAILRDWAETLPPAQRIIVNQVIDEIETLAEGGTGDAIIDYKLDKRVSAPFNLIVGAQYQFNKKFILRTELGVFGKRSQFLLNFNYRFSSFRRH